MAGERETSLVEEACGVAEGFVTQSGGTNNNGICNIIGSVRIIQLLSYNK